MALPSSGQLGMVPIANEMGINPLTGLSLRGMSSISGSSTPDAISEFYSYSQTDAQRYKNAVTNTGYTLNGTEISAIDDLFSDLNTYGLYSKIYGFYPMIGGGQAQILNAKSVSGVREYNYDLTFNGGWGFGAYGAEANGNYSTYTANYSYDSNTIRFSHLGTYITDDGTYQNGWDIAILDTTNDYPYAFMTMYSGQSSYAEYSYNYTSTNQLTAGNYSGNNMMSYDDANSSYAAYQNENFFTSQSINPEAIGYPTRVVGGYDYLTSTFTDKTFGFITFGDALTGIEMADYQLVINTFQTTLGRNTY